MTNPSLLADVISELLAHETVPEQAAILRAARLLDHRGLDLLLDETEDLADVEPVKARQISMICEQVAEIAGAPAAIGRAQYLRAQTYAIHGEFDLALEHIRQAATNYAALGMKVEALRTQVGLMNVLDELGRYADVLEAGRAALDEIARLSSVTPQESWPELQRISGRIYVNLGVSYMQLGRYQDSIASYGLAEADFAALNDREWLANVISNQGLILTYLGRVREAVGTFERAIELRTGMPPSLSHAHTFLNMGEALCLLGNYAQSLEAFRQAHTLLLTLDARVDQQINQLHMAEVYLTLNLFPEALAAYAEAEVALNELNMLYERGLALWGIGAARMAQMHFDEAESALAKAVFLFRQIDNAPLCSSVILEQAALLARQQQRDQAVAHAQQALALVSSEKGSWPVQQLYAHLRLADLLLPDTEAAEAHLEKTEHILSTLTLPHLRYRLLQRFGHLRLLQGRDAEAQSYLESAIAEIEQLRNTVTHEVMRTSFLYDKVAAYEMLIQLYLRRGDEQAVQLAFDVAERSRARALVDLLAGVVEGQSQGGDDLGSLTQLHALQADLNALYNQFFESSIRRENPLFIQQLQARTIELEQQISLLRLQALPQVAHAKFADTIEASFSIAEIQTQLPPGVVMLNYYILDDEIIAFVITRHHFHLVRGLSTTTTVQQLLRRLDLQWERFRAGRAFVERHMHLLEQSTQRLLASLYDALIAPLMSFLPSAYTGENTESRAPKLTIVPHGLLHQVPFQALCRNGTYLLEEFSISYAPSATAWVLCQQRRGPKSEYALVMGVVDAALPAVEVEVKAVTQVLQAAQYRVDLRLNEDASVATLRAAVAECHLLHIACHGLFRADNPMFSALKLHDGWFTASDAMQLALPGATVVLSACESGRSRVVIGDESIGLIRAFLGAGAASLIVSQWLVQDEAAAFLITSWYEELMALQNKNTNDKTVKDKAAALRTAQLATKARYPHPYYWAPFVLIGQVHG